MSRKRKLTVIKRRLTSGDNLVKMQRCQLCSKPTMNAVGRCASCRRLVGLVTTKIVEAATEEGKGKDNI